MLIRKNYPFELSTALKESRAHDICIPTGTNSRRKRNFLWILGGFRSEFLRQQGQFHLIKLLVKYGIH